MSFLAQRKPSMDNFSHWRICFRNTLYNHYITMLWLTVKLNDTCISKETEIPKWLQEPFKFTHLMFKIHRNTKYLTNLLKAIYDSLLTNLLKKVSHTSSAYDTSKKKKHKYLHGFISTKFRTNMYCF